MKWANARLWQSPFAAHAKRRRSEAERDEHGSATAARAQQAPEPHRLSPRMRWRERSSFESEGPIKSVPVVKAESIAVSTALKKRAGQPACTGVRTEGSVAHKAGRSELSLGRKLRRGEGMG
eukprot:4733137-Pleurochrysis_carterae.AAC.2